MESKKIDIGIAARGRNGRKTSEDRYSVSEHMVGVYDGHGGSEVSEYVSKHLPRVFQATQDFVVAFEQVDKDMEEYDSVMHRMAGTTATCAHFTPQGICVANVGDSRAILITPEEGDVQVLTVEDNCRTNVEEVNRIKQCGGRVIEHRVDRILAVTRAIGDGDFRESGVIPKPHIVHVATPPAGSILVLATDGLWDVVSSEGVRQALNSVESVSAQVLANLLLEKAVSRRTMDDTTVMVIKF